MWNEQTDAPIAIDETVASFQMSEAETSWYFQGRLAPKRPEERVIVIRRKGGRRIISK